MGTYMQALLLQCSEAIKNKEPVKDTDDTVNTKLMSMRAQVLRTVTRVFNVSVILYTTISNYNTIAILGLYNVMCIMCL
jgi:hypothetical protein